MHTDAQNTEQKLSNIFSIAVLEKSSNAYMKLHQKVALTAGTKGDVKLWHSSQVRRHFEAGHSGIAIIHGTSLMVGQLLLTFPEKGQTNHLQGYPFDHYAMDETAVIQSLGVHPSYRSHNLGPHLLKQACHEAAVAGRTHLLAKIRVTNNAGLNSFLNADFKEHSTQTLACDDYASTFVVKALSAADILAPVKKQQTSSLLYA